MKQTIISKPLQEAEKAIEKIKKIIPTLNESERATLELMLDAESQKEIVKSREDIKKGNFLTLEDFKKL